MLYLAFVLGLLGSFHCVGMCGPIALLLPLRRDNSLIKFLQIGMYFLGKTLTYTLLSCLFWLIGRGFFIREYQQNFSIFVGVIMVIVGILSAFQIQIKIFQNPLFSGLNYLKSALRKQLQNKNFVSVFLIGFLNGFLPCGLVYTALFSALASVNLIDVVLYMIFFGLGTLPLMLLFIYVGNFLSASARKYIQKIIPFAIIVFGILFVLRGLGIGIHMVSPSNTDLMLQNNPDCVVPMK